jgi:hypothetical protein
MMRAASDISPERATPLVEPRRGRKRSSSDTKPPTTDEVPQLTAPNINLAQTFAFFRGVDMQPRRQRLLLLALHQRHDKLKKQPEEDEVY